MRNLLAFAALAAALLGSGCADTPPPEEVGEQLQRGLSGQGQLAPIDRQDDPYVNPRGASDIPQ